MQQVYLGRPPCQNFASSQSSSADDDNIASDTSAMDERTSAVLAVTSCASRLFGRDLLADADLGQIFITQALFKQLETEGHLAVVLGHEIGHVVAGHSAERIAKAQLLEGLTGAAGIAACDPENP